jgi:putative nucleotidyltransferase with HDIG domain
LLQIFLPVFPSALVLYVAIVGPLALAYVELSPWAALLFLFPALAAQRLFTMYQEQRRLATDLSAANQSLVRANLSFASALVTTLDARDRYTAGHSAAVAVYARDIAGRMELPQETQHLAHLSGLLHDIGKVGVPPGVLEKNGPLTLQERRKMEEHSVIGERILANVEAYSEIALIVRHHHERIDGEGYPDGIVGTEIPLISRIICVADAYNAMTSDRPYRDAMEVAVARGRLLQAAGSQFDPEVIAAFDQILETASDTYSSGARADFALEAQAHPELSPNLEVSAA